MATILKEERYIAYIGTEEHVLRVQELLGGSEAWPERFRVQIPASRERPSRTFYGSTGRGVVEQATEYLSNLSAARTSLSPGRFEAEG
jgi:hypothetical protein